MPRIKKVIITNEEFYYKDSIYVDFYKCPNCRCNEIREGNSYCPDCGCKIEWNISKKRCK